MHRTDPLARGRGSEAVLSASAAETAPGEACDVCGAPTIEIRCKVICLRCGYVRDCSDP